MVLPIPKANVTEEVEYILIGAGRKSIKEYLHIQQLFLGLPRTGTLSTFTALEKLLPGKCYHMMRANQGKNIVFWAKASDGILVDSDWENFLR